MMMLMMGKTTKKSARDLTASSPLHHSGAELDTATSELQEAERYLAHDSCPESCQNTEADGPTKRPF